MLSYLFHRGIAALRGYLAYIIRQQLKFIFLLCLVLSRNFRKWFVQLLKSPSFVCSTTWGGALCLACFDGRTQQDGQSSFCCSWPFFLRSSTIRLLDLITWHREGVQWAAHYLNVNKTNNREKEARTDLCWPGKLKALYSRPKSSWKYYIHPLNQVKSTAFTPPIHCIQTHPNEYTLSYNFKDIAA